MGKNKELSENISIIKAVLDRDFSTLKNYTDTLVGQRLSSAIETKKNEVIAKFNSGN